MDILLIAGMWLDGRAWDAVVPALEAAGHTPVALSLPGQGPERSPATLDDQVDTVVAAIDAADGPVLVVGHSAAATLAWLAADRRPGKVARVALVGGFPGDDGEPYFPVFPAVEGVVTFPGWEPFEGPDSADLDEAARRRIESLCVPVAEGVTGGVVRYESARRFDVPVTLVCPEFSAADARAWVAAGDVPELARARHVDEIDVDSGHWPMFSVPDALATALVEAAERPHLLDLPPWEPPITGTDAEHLGASLDRLRATFRWKADGLTIDQLRRRLPSSRLSLGGLLRHLAVVEDDIFAGRIADERSDVPASMPEGADPEAWMFDLADDVTADDLYAVYDDAVRRARERYRSLVEDGGLDAPAAMRFGGLRPHARRHVHDMLEEYGRHTGHADLLREAIDGRVGEDPDPTWTWAVLTETRTTTG